MNDITRMKTQSQPARWTPWGEIPVATRSGAAGRDRPQSKRSVVSLRERMAWLERLTRGQRAS
ncbi:hypothetical protein [Nitratireductor alexandrii]|uniref:hypothetical protein n=1 Tax=Nitratireductor alexandrii TaxID=2448161 RepID=UPI000FDC0472|nr:hypothetical protein [Nitratireductor alexandrii]